MHRCGGRGLRVKDGGLFVAVMLVLLGGVLSLLAGCSPVAIVLLSLGLTGSIVGFARAVLRMRREQ